MVGGTGEAILIKQELRQMPLAEFEYEITKGARFLNLYDRVSSKNGKDILRFLAQVPMRDCTTEHIIKQAVDKAYENKTTPSRMRIHVDLIASPCWFTLSDPLDYIRKSSC